MRKLILTSSSIIHAEYSKHFEVFESVELIPAEKLFVIMISYGKLIPHELLTEHIFSVFIIPYYRSMHAFTWTMIHGETHMGFTLHLVDEGVDSGDILEQLTFEVGFHEDINEVFKGCFASKVL